MTAPGYTKPPAAVIVRRLLVVVGVVLLALGALFAFLPVPVQQVSALGTTSQVFCGPGTSSDPSLVVWANPSVTTQDTTPPPSASETQYIESTCIGAAEGRLSLALGLAIAGALSLALAAWAMPYILEGRKPSWLRGSTGGSRFSQPPRSYADSKGAGRERWWEGSGWTDHHRPR